jgi:hypothetical protein
VKTWVIHMPAGSQTVTADRVFEHEGLLKFVRNVEGKQWGDVAAIFRPGHWTYIKLIGEA